MKAQFTASVLAAAFGLISTNTATAQETFDWSGAWHGTIEAPTGDVRVGFSFSTDGTGALEGAIESPDQAPGEYLHWRKSPSTAMRLSLKCRS